MFYLFKINYQKITVQIISKRKISTKTHQQLYLLAVTAILFIRACALTQFVFNTVSDTLLCPIDITISKQMATIYGLRKTRYGSCHCNLYHIFSCNSYCMAVLPWQLISTLKRAIPQGIALFIILNSFKHHLQYNNH